MKKLLLLILIAISGLVFYECNQKSGALDAEALKMDIVSLIASDTKVDNAVESSSYETDLYSLGSNSIAGFSSGNLKSAELGGGSFFRTMFDHFPKFKLHFRKGIAPDMTVTTTNGGYPKTIVIDYGDSTQLANGRVLSGKITIVLSAAPFTWGSTQTITYTNFCNDSVCTSGKAVKTRTKDPQIKFSESADLTITLADGTIVHRVEDKARTWTSGSATEFDPSDDVIEITGKVVVSDSKKNSYSKIITSPLIKTGECRFISKGIIEYKNSFGKFATVDYGNGTCDNTATRTTQDGTTTITLGRQGKSS